MSISLHVETHSATADELSALAQLFIKLSSFVARTEDAQEDFLDSFKPPATSTIPMPPAPVAAPTPPAPVAAPTPPAPAGATPERDARGMPWDARIHSANRDLTGKGVWRQRRGTPEELIQQVEAELMGAPSAPPAPVAPEAPPLIAPTPPVPPPAAVPSAPSEPLTMNDLVTRLSAAYNAGTATVAQTNQVFSEMGLEGGLIALQGRPDLMSDFMHRHGL